MDQNDALVQVSQPERRRKLGLWALMRSIELWAAIAAVAAGIMGSVVYRLAMNGYEGTRIPISDSTLLQAGYLLLAATFALLASAILVLAGHQNDHRPWFKSSLFLAAAILLLEIFLVLGTFVREVLWPLAAGAG